MFHSLAQIIGSVELPNEASVKLPLHILPWGGGRGRESLTVLGDPGLRISKVDKEVNTEEEVSVS